MIDLDSKFTSIEDILNWPCVYIRDTNIQVNVVTVEYKDSLLLVEVYIPNVGQLTPEVIKKLQSFEVTNNSNFQMAHSNSVNTGLALTCIGTVTLDNLSKTPYGTEMGSILYGKRK